MFGRGFGRGFGRWGWGARLGYCPWTGQPAARFAGPGYGPGWGWRRWAASPAEEREVLETMARQLREQLQWVEERLRNLQTGSEGE